MWVPMAFYPGHAIALTSEHRASALHPFPRSLSHQEQLMSTKENAPPCEVALGEVVGMNQNSACTESG